MIGVMLWALRQNTDATTAAIEADAADRASSYICPNPECQARVLLKAIASPLVVAHFAHASATRCDWNENETPQHRRAKRDLRDAFRRQGLSAQVEAPLAFLPLPDSRADVLVTLPSGQPVAIELQHTSLAIERIVARTQLYAAKQIPVLWLPFVPDSVRARRKQLKPQPRATWLLEKFSAPAWHRWIEAYQLGALWYYDDRKHRLLECRLSQHWLYAQPREFWNPKSRDIAQARGKFYPSRRWSDLRITRVLPLDQVAIALTRRRAANIGGFELPASHVVRLEAAG